MADGRLEKIWNDAWPELAVEIGKVSGARFERKFGYDLAIDATASVVWSAGGTYSWPTSAATLTVTSDSTLDNATGTAGRTFTVYGLGTDWKETTATGTLNGTASVAITGTQFYRVNRVTVDEVGVYGGNNTGNLTFLHGTAAIAYVPAMAGVTQQMVYTVPANATAYVTQFLVTEDSNKALTFFAYVRDNADNFTSLSPFRQYARYDGLTGPFINPIGRIYPLPPKSDLEIRALSSSQTGSASVELAMIVIYSS